MWLQLAQIDFSEFVDLKWEEEEENHLKISLFHLDRDRYGDENSSADEDLSPEAMLANSNTFIIIEKNVVIVGVIESGIHGVMYISDDDETDALDIENALKDQTTAEPVALTTERMWTIWKNYANDDWDLEKSHIEDVTISSIERM